MTMSAAGLHGVIDEAAAGAAILCSVGGEGAALPFLGVLQAEDSERQHPETPAPELAVRGFGMGATAPANLYHFVTHPAIAYR